MKISKCKICHKKGHWHRECPDNPDNKVKGRSMSAYTFTGAVGVGATPETISQWRDLQEEITKDGVFLVSLATQALVDPGAGSDLVGVQALNRES